MEAFGQQVCLFDCITSEQPWPLFVQEFPGNGCPGRCVAMVSVAPSGSMLHGIAIHASASRVLACVNREGLQAVRAVIGELGRGFLGNVFHVHCLGLAALDDSMAEQRLQRVLRIRFGNQVICDERVWWYRTQLYLHFAIAKNPMSFQDLSCRCYALASQQAQACQAASRPRHAHLRSFENTFTKTQPIIGQRDFT